MNSRAVTVSDYLKGLPADRREAITGVRNAILDSLPAGYEEVMQSGMICYVVPLARFPKTYNGYPLQIAALASQKNYMSLYLMCVYGDKKTENWFRTEFAKSGKMLDMGKSCVRFKKLDDLPLELVGRAVARVSVDDFIALYKKSREKGTT